MNRIYTAVIITTLYFTMSMHIKQPILYGLFTESWKHSYLEVKYMCKLYIAQNVVRLLKINCCLVVRVH